VNTKVARNTERTGGGVRRRLRIEEGGERTEERGVKTEEGGRRREIRSAVVSC
jgi:hypothetical protein